MEAAGRNRILNGPSGKNTIEVIDFIGRGAFGEVFKGIDLKTEQLYAIKFPGISELWFDGSNREIRAFLNEIQAAGTIDNDFVVKILYVESEDTTPAPFLVMELLEEGTLHDKLNEFRTSGKLPPDSLIKQWSLEIAKGMEAINSKLLHRDIKPDNILLHQGHIKISDFGLSKIVDASTRNGTFKGQQHVMYMAPEGWKGETNKIQLDMYSVGIVLFEIATLEYPYKRPSDFRNPSLFSDMHLFGTPQSVQVVRPDLPRGYSQIVTKLMEKRPSDRFDTWEDVINELKQTWDKTESIDTSPIREDISNLGDIMNTKYQRQRALELEEEKRRTQEQERKRFDIHQINLLIEQLTQVINEFNNANAQFKIQVQGPASRAIEIGLVEYPYVQFNIPHVSSPPRLEFFKVTPDIEMRKQGWSVGLAGVLSNTLYSKAINFLLCRETDDPLYGKWVVLEVYNSPLVRARRTDEPMAFSSNEVMQKELEISNSAMHVYNLQFSEDIAAGFIKYIQMIMQ